MDTDGSRNMAFQFDLHWSLSLKILWIKNIGTHFMHLSLNKLFVSAYDIFKWIIWKVLHFAKCFFGSDYQ